MGCKKLSKSTQRMCRPVGFRAVVTAAAWTITGWRLGYLNPRRSGLQRAVQKKAKRKITRIHSVSSMSWMC